MKKLSLPLVAGLIFFGNSTSTVSIIEQRAGILMRNITSYHNALFGANNLFEHAPSKQNVDNWNRVVESIDYFVTNNAKPESNFWRTRNLDAELKEHMQTLKTLNKTLIITLENSYKILSATSDPNVRKDLAESMSGLVKNIESLEIEIKQAQDQGYNNIENTLSASLLYRLAISLATSASKMQKDIVK